MDNDNFDYLDKIIPHLPDGKINIAYIKSEIDFPIETGRFLMEEESIIYDVCRQLARMGYISLLVDDSIDSIYEMTAKGREAKEAGGHFAYLEKIAKQAELAREKKAKEEQDAAFQKILSGLTLFVAFLAVVVSCISLYYSNKGEETKITIQEQLHQQTQLQKKLLLRTDSMQLLINTLISQDSLPKKHL